MTSKLKNISFFIICFSLGLGFFYTLSENISVQRDPATTNGKVFQITNLSSEQIKEQLQKKIKVMPTVDGIKAISFSGFSSALCKTYSLIEIEFLAEGVAVAGESTSMKIVAPCAAGQDPTEMAQVTLPISKILSEKPKSAEYTFDGFNAVVSFKNAADEWPTQWILKRVEFKNTNDATLSKSAEFGRSPASVEEKQIILEF